MRYESLCQGSRGIPWLPAIRKESSLSLPRVATMNGLRRAFRIMKAMEAQGIDWGEGYRRAGAAALEGIPGADGGQDRPPFRRVGGALRHPGERAQVRDQRHLAWRTARTAGTKDERSATAWFLKRRVPDVGCNALPKLALNKEVGTQPLPGGLSTAVLRQDPNLWGRPVLRSRF